MQQVAIDVVCAEMFERTGHRLGDLNGEAGFGIVRQPVVLTALVREFRLQKKIVARNHPCAITDGQTLTHCCLVVVSALVRCVDATNTRAKRELDEGRGTFFFPGCSVEKRGIAWRVATWHRAMLSRQAGPPADER